MILHSVYCDARDLPSSPWSPSNKRMQQTALVFKRKVIVFMRWDESSSGLGHLARWLITPQLMRRAVRRHTVCRERIGTCR
jgi:hypothetical protein